MRPSMIATVLLVVQVSFACAWKGTYEGVLRGVPVTLALDCAQQIYVGRMEAEGYPYAFRLVPTGPTSAIGNFRDPQLGGEISCTASWHEDTLEVHIGEREAATGVTPLHLVFHRVTSAPSVGVPVEGQGALDERLVGLWTYSESHVSGTFSFATQWRLTLLPDGTLRQVGRTVGGGPDVSGDSGEGEVSSARWRTVEGRLELDIGAGFKHYARYVCDGDRVMFTLVGGDKQVWVRE